jgi:hypothetical protein
MIGGQPGGGGGGDFGQPVDLGGQFNANGDFNATAGMGGSGGGNPNQYVPGYGYSNPMAGRVANVGGGYGYQQPMGGGSFTGSGTFGGGGGGGGGGRGSFGGHGSYLNYLQAEADIQQRSQDRASGMGQDFISRGMYGTTAPDTAIFGVQRGADAAVNRLGGNPGMRAQALGSEYNQLYSRIAQDLKSKGITDPAILHQYVLRAQNEYRGAVNRIPGGGYGGYRGGGGGGMGGGGYRIPMAAYGNWGGGTTDGSQGYYIPDQAWGGA